MRKVNDHGIGRVITLILLYLFISATLITGQKDQPKYKDYRLSVDERVADLISRMTIEEKIDQMSHLAPAIERHHLPPMK